MLIYMDIVYVITQEGKPQQGQMWVTV